MSELEPQVFISNYEDEGARSSPNESYMSHVLIVISYLIIILTFPISLLACIKIIQEYNRAVVFRLGRVIAGRAKGPGLYFILPCIDDFRLVDMRTISFDVPPQEILTKDSVTVAVDAVVFYRVFNATISLTNVTNASGSTRLLAQTVLRNALGSKNLSQVLMEREEMSQSMQLSLDKATDPWGIKVEHVEIKDVRLPVQLQRAMAAEAEASREAKAKVIAAKGEHEAAHALKKAGDIIRSSQPALQLRYLQTLNHIAAEKNSTIVFPLPMEMFSTYSRSSSDYCVIKKPPFKSPSPKQPVRAQSAM